MANRRTRIITNEDISGLDQPRRGDGRPPLRSPEEVARLLAGKKLPAEELMALVFELGADLEATRAALEAAQGRLNSTQAELAGFRAAQADMEAARAGLEAMQAELANVQHIKAEMEATRTRLAAIHAEIQHLHRRRGQLAAGTPFEPDAAAAKEAEAVAAPPPSNPKNRRRRETPVARIDEIIVDDSAMTTIRGRGERLPARPRPRGMWGQLWLLALEPGVFFRSLPRMGEGRAWVWAAVLILALTGFSAVRQEALRAEAETNGAAGPGFDVGAPPGTDVGGGVIGGGGGGGVIIGGGGGVPAPGPGGDGGFGPPPPDGGAGQTADVSATWTTALVAGSHIVLGWAILALLLSEVSLLKGRAPRLGHNLHIAIWTTLPLGLMAGLQLIYFAGGGPLRQPGISGLLPVWEQYAELPPFPQSVALSLTSQLTLFWAWGLLLVYSGARHALNGKRWASALVVVAWAVVLVVAPVVTGAIKAEPVEAAPGGDGLSADMIPLPGGEGMPPGLDPFAPEMTQEAGQPATESAPVEGGTFEIAPGAGSFQVVPGAEVTPEAEITAEAPNSP